MSRSTKKRRMVYGAIIGAAATLALVAGFSVFAGAGVAASAAAPVNTSPPTITGTAQEGSTLVGDRGKWSGTVADYNDVWVRCDKDGGSCATISGAESKAGYVLKGVDVGNTIRFKVEAKNADGSTFASSVPTAVIVAATKPAPTPVTGCPAGTGVVQVAELASPARLLIDGQQADPRWCVRARSS